MALVKATVVQISALHCTAQPPDNRRIHFFARLGKNPESRGIFFHCSSCLMKESPSSLQCYRFWPWAIAGRGEYQRRTGGNEQGLMDPPGNYGLSCSINISKKLQTPSLITGSIWRSLGPLGMGMSRMPAVPSNRKTEKTVQKKVNWGCKIT